MSAQVRTRMHFGILLLMVTLLAGAQVWLSYLRIEVSQQGYQLQQNINKQHDDIQNLELEYASLARPNRLRQLAHKELGMQAPTPMQVLEP
ncbi:MAG: cell division protein FtsL [Mariprofundaceae bacterium]|nr:cell division protein FtsL [Mariprofundaceae bacterium]